MYLFLAVLSLHGHTGVFASYGEFRLLSSCSVQVLTSVASLVTEHRLLE